MGTHNYDIASIARQRTAKAIRKLAQVMSDTSLSGSTRLWAAQVMLARGWGGSTLAAQPAQPGSLEAEARSFGPDIVNTLDALLDDAAQPASVTVWAVQMVLDCAYGPAARRAGGMKTPRVPALPQLPAQNPYKSSLLSSGGAGQGALPGLPVGVKG